MAHIKATSDVSLPVPRFTSGLRPDTIFCPRCNGRLVREPAFFHCLPCGKFYPVRGADYSGQEGVGTMHVLEGVKPASASARSRPGRRADWQK